MMENTFIINGKKCRVTLDNTGLTWIVQDCSQGKFRVPAAEIISCWSCPKGSLECCPLQDEAFNQTYLQNEGFPQYPEGKLGTISTTSTSLLFGNNAELHYGGFETEHGSLDRGVHASRNDNRSATRPLHPSGILDTSEEKINIQILDTNEENINIQSKPTDRPTGIPFKNCIHFCKVSSLPALSVEICERVLPSQLFSGCFRGDEEPMATTWKSRVLVLQHESTDTVSSWMKTLWEIVAGNPSRPRHLLVIVNPMSGKKKAVKLYKSRVAPLLRRAAIRITFRETTHSGHAEELAEGAVREGGVDGVVTVGGDGTVAEVTTGLMKATARQLGVPFDDRTAALPEANVAVGVIPGGSTNAYVTSCHGTEDVTTAVLQIVMGSRRYVHVGGVYVQDKLAHVSPEGIHVGFLASMLETSTRLRHMGPVRDVIAGVKEFVLNRSCSYELRYLAEENERDLLRLDAPVCRADCVPCATECPDTDAGEWVEIKGDLHIAACHLVRAECRYSKYGISPTCHVNSGYCDIMLIPKASRVSMFYKLFRLGTTRDHLTKSSVQAFRTREIHIKFPSPAPPLNCDGELRYHPEFVLKVHRQCVPVYSRGREPLSTLDLSTLTNNFE